MPDDVAKKLKEYKEDSRSACQFGLKCYQKNAQHQEKYKHPPKPTQPIQRGKIEEAKGKKRTNEDFKDETESGSSTPPSKHKKDHASPKVVDAHDISPSPNATTDEDSDELDDEDTEKPTDNAKPLDSTQTDNDNENSSTKIAEAMSSNKDDESTKDATETVKDNWIAPENMKNSILELFLVEMPKDFYKFYDFCRKLAPNDPSSALKAVDIQLVGPYDVLSGKIREVSNDDKAKFLKHWRYFYDPPEFQTVLKGNDKEGLHYGYWHDVCEEKPVFVAKNSANKDCKIIPVSPNIFGAVLIHVEERLKVANPFEKNKISKILQALKTFAKENKLILDKNSADMRLRDRKVVAKTFHGAGIVVPYDKKTQIGYRDLAATESHFRKVLQQMDKAESEEKKQEHMTTIEEVVRLATIAADECDFGTPLELGHDLFSSGVDCIQNTALMMLTMAYNLLKRQQFLKIAMAHLSDRKKGCNLSVI